MSRIRGFRFKRRFCRCFVLTKLHLGFGNHGQEFFVKTMIWIFYVQKIYFHSFQGFLTALTISIQITDNFVGLKDGLLRSHVQESLYSGFRILDQNYVKDKLVLIKCSINLQADFL